MTCGKCGKSNDESAKFCSNCGHRLFEDRFSDNKAYEVVDDYEIIDKKVSDHIHCPKCGSSNIHFVNKEEGSDFDADTACCGFLLFGPLGILCGLFSDKQTKIVRKCMKCGHEF